MEKIKEMFNENYFYIKEKVKVTLKELYPYIVIMIVVMLFRTFIATPVRVDGISMVDTLHDGEILILNKLDKSYKRFDIVVINYGDTKIVKRIIGLPGENIEYKDNELYINNSKIEDKAIARTNDFTLKGIYDGLEKIPDDYYFVMGDNRVGQNSADSRYAEIGLIKKSDIVGTTTIRLFPFNKFGKFN